MELDRRWKERGETLGPAFLALAALALDLWEDGQSVAHAAAVGVVALAAGWSGAGAVLSLGRFGASGLGRRFALWRAFGLTASAGCLCLDVVERLPAPWGADDGVLQLGVLGAAWALLTGWVWGRGSWERMSGRSAPPEKPPAAEEAPDGVRWTDREIGRA